MYYQERLPRKLKLRKIGRIRSKASLRRLNNDVIINCDKGDKLYLHGKEINYCPYCGCENSTLVDYHAEYPEQWWDLVCNRCNRPVISVDNSFPIHALSIIREC